MVIDLSQVSSLISQNTSLTELEGIFKTLIIPAQVFLALDGVTDDYSDLSSLITDIGSEDAEIWFKDGTALIGSSITIPANIKLKFIKGGKISISSGKSLTINGEIEAGLHQIFTGSGLVLGSPKLKEAYPQWWGATGDGTTADKSAFDKLFAFCTTTKVKAYIPKGTYNIATPLNEIGTDSFNSTEYGNFIIEGECMHDTILSFALSSDSDVAFKLANRSAGWNISNFRLKNSSGKGIGFYFDEIYKSTVENLQAIYFDIGFKKQSYITTFRNLNGTNCHCGFYDLGGTSTLNISCYAASNTIPNGDVRDLAGCGYYITASDYNSYISCASDSNVYAYKVKGSASTYVNTSDTLTFDNCGCETCNFAYYFDHKGLEVSIIRPTIYDISGSDKKFRGTYAGGTSYILKDAVYYDGNYYICILASTGNLPTNATYWKLLYGALAHVENAIRVNIKDFSDSVLHEVSRNTANCGVGVVRFDSGFNTGGNPSYYPIYARQNTYERSLFGINDFSHDGVSFNADYTFSNGRLMKFGNTIEFKLYARGSGATAGAKVDICPMINYTGEDIDRGGSVYIGLFNYSNILYKNSSKTNSGHKITITEITESTIPVGITVLIEPFDSLTNPTENVALITVDAFVSPVGADFYGKNHNIKTSGNYSGRTNLLLKGADY